MPGEAPPREVTVADRVVTTHLMIRVALIGISLAIALSVVYQRTQEDCWLTSISAYWYTDARAIFAGGLMVIGVCLVAYSGGTWTENLLLNLAGALAPIVAIAPTRLGKSLDEACLGDRAPAAYDAEATTNGLAVYFALLVAGALLTIVMSKALARRLDGDKGALPPAQQRASRVGQGVALALAAGLVIWSCADELFPQRAHFPAAAIMFFFLALVALSRSDWGSALTKKWDVYRDEVTIDAAAERDFGYSKLYLCVGVGMLFTLAAAGANLLLEKQWASGWDYGVIAAEFVLLGWFLVFWVAQTIQMRDLTQIGAAPPEVEGSDGSGGSAVMA